MLTSHSLLVGIAGLTGEPVGGALIGRMGGGYLSAQCFAGGCVAVGALLCALARWWKVGLAVVKV